MTTEHPRCPVCDAPQEVERLKQELSDITLAVDAAADQCDLLPIFDTPAKKIQALGDLAQSYKEDYDESCGALKQANARAARSDSYAEGLLGRIQQHNRDLAEQCAARKCHFKEYDLRCPECPKDYELEMTDADLAPPSNVIPTTPQEPPIYGGAFAFDHRAGTLTPVASIPTGAPEPKVDHVFPLYPDTRQEAHEIGAHIPEGWKLVPMKPTEEMVRAARERFHGAAARHLGIGEGTYRGTYEAMIAAAPDCEYAVGDKA
jgi:hypothetical protein